MANTTRRREATSALSSGKLKTILNYDPATGHFTYLVKTHARVVIGARAGTVGRDGYRTISVDSAEVPEHRAAFLWMTGCWPAEGMEVDHIDGVRDNNAWSNLRAIPKYANLQNRKKARIDSSTGLMGVMPNGSGYTARIKLPGHKQKTNLGTFKTPEEAHAAYLKAKRELHEGNTL